MTAFRQTLIQVWNRRKGSRCDFNAVSLHIQSLPEPSLQGWTAEAEQHSAHRGQAEETWRNGTARDAYHNGRRRSEGICRLLRHDCKLCCAATTTYSRTCSQHYGYAGTHTVTAHMQQ